MLGWLILFMLGLTGVAVVVAVVGLLTYVVHTCINGHCCSDQKTDMLLNTQIDDERDDILPTSSSLLPPLKFLNLPEYKQETETIISRSYGEKAPLIVLSTKLIQLWYPGALRVVEEAGITFINDIDLRVIRILEETGYPDFDEAPGEKAQEDP